MPAAHLGPDFARSHAAIARPCWAPNLLVAERLQR